MKMHIGGLIFDVTTTPGMPPESFAIVSEREAALWDGKNIVFLSRAEWDRRLAERPQGAEK